MKIKNLIAATSVLGAVTLGVTVPAQGVPLTGTTTAPSGDLSGWKQVFSENFNADAATGSFLSSSYGDKWSSYDGSTDTSGNGTYSPGKVLSAHDGVLDMHLRTEDGKALVAAPSPSVDGKWIDQKYGRYSVRFKADPVAGYKTAWLQWPETGEWSDGEIDFPEGNLNSTIEAFNHCPGNPESNCDHKITSAKFTDWHVATTEWTPEGVTFYLDGKEVSSSTTSPTVAMHWILQTETRLSGGAPPADAAGHVYVDWAVMYSRDA